MKELPVVQPAPQPFAPATSDTAGMVADPARTAALRPAIVAALHKVFDPEIPVDIYELGLIYEVIVTSESAVGIRMTLTAEVRNRVAEIDGVSDVKVDVVWDPPWDRDRMSDAARLQLGMF